MITKNTSSPVVKLTAPGILALLAMATIVWLTTESIAPAPKTALPKDALEFMLAAQPAQAVPGGEGEWRLAPIFFDAGADAQEGTRSLPPVPPARFGAGAPRRERERFALPQAGRDLLAQRFEPPSTQPRNAPRDTPESLRGTEAADAAPPPGARQPRIALALARAGMDNSNAGLSSMPSESAGEGQTRPSRPNSGARNSIASTSALANASGLPEQSLDDLFTLKLHGEYGMSKATQQGGGLFRDRFLRLGGKKRFDFAGMDQVDLKVDGIFTTAGQWNTEAMDQDLSGIALNVGPEIKFPELPVKLDLNAGAGWLRRESTLRQTGVLGAAGDRADIESMVYGGGAALRNDWQWRMFTVTGLAGVQYAAATDKAHAYEDPDTGVAGGQKVGKLTRSAWELPVQLRVGGEYKLLNALSVLPSVWGGYTYNITGKNGAFHSGHVAGAEMNWRRNGMTWNRSSYNFGGELRLRAVDRFEMWVAHQKEWAGNDSGSYTGGGVQVAF